MKTRRSSTVWWSALSFAAFAAAAGAMLAHADATALSVSCAGAVSGNQVTWTATSSGGTAPYALLWSGSGITGSVTGTSVTATYSANGTYTAMIQSTDASSTVATSSCAATVSSFNSTTTPPVTPTTTVPALPRVNKPMLTISGNGNFLVHGMTVTSVSSDSFEGSVWGITYTVEWNGSLVPEFYLRGGDSGGAGTDPVAQLSVGDEVGVSGRISSSSPMTVQANVVRDYSIMTLRPGRREGQSTSPFYNGIGQGGEHDGTEVNASGTASSTIESLSVRLQNLMNQFHDLQNLFQHGNGNGGNGGH